jgi:hypothetical protein
MNLLTSRIEKIKAALKAKDLNQAATLLIHTLASDEVFSYWSDCCQGSERVPKILKYIHQITFDEALPTANVDLRKGDLTIGVQFFLDHITGPEDLLFILIHERNHLILRRLYPDILPGFDYPREIFNFAEDAYVNAIGRRQVASTLPERFYRQPVELLLTAKHSQIDWTLFSLNGNGTHNYLKHAHACLYQWNPALLQALGETVGLTSGFSGYRRWMDLVSQWYRGKEAEEARKRETAASRGNGEVEERTKPEEIPAPSEGTKDDDATEKELEEVGKNQTAFEGESQDSDEELDQKENGDAGSDGGPEPDQEEPLAAVGENSPEPGGQEGGQAGASEAGEGVAKDDGFHELAEVIKTYAPLVQGSALEIEGSEASESGSGIRKVPIPDLKPGDPVFNMILETSDLSEFRHQVRLFEPKALSGIDDAIQGVLADRATEKTLEGYSIPVPAAITRKDLFSLAGGVIPAVWERRWGVERPNIDLYIDVSGSMGHYYGYIPYIYDALRAVRGRVFQFSTRVVEVDPEDPFLHTTGGTRFDAVAQHLLAEGSQAAIILSDGHGLLSNRYIEALRDQLETLIYIKVQPNREQNWEHVATEVIVLTWSDDPEG